MHLPHHHPSAPPSLPLAANEHLVLIRQLARLQVDMTELVNHHAAERQRWQHRLMRQSVRLVLERTRAAWNITDRPNDDNDETLFVDLSSAQEAEQLICRTGWVMDGFHWRDGVRCKRTNVACHMADTASTNQALPTGAN